MEGESRSSEVYGSDSISDTYKSHYWENIKQCYQRNNVDDTIIFMSLIAERSESAYFSIRKTGRLKHLINFCFTFQIFKIYPF